MPAKVVQIERKTKFILSFSEIQPTFEACLKDANKKPKVQNFRLVFS
jgi:hypothetical protein